MIAEGDAMTIDDLLQTKLVELRKGTWAILYRHKDTEQLWDLVYPQGEMHGGGPRRLRQLDHRDPEKWHPYPELIQIYSPLSFRDAPIGAGRKSRLPVVVMDSGFVRFAHAPE
jgi:hypothetical protein